MSLSNNVLNPNIVSESSNVVFTSEFSDINNSEPILNIDILLTLEDQLRQLQQDNLNMKMEHDRAVTKLTKERDDGEEKMKEMSSDLEQQIEECIDINIKFDDTVEVENDFKINLLKMINELPKSLVNLEHIVETIKRSIKGAVEENIIINSLNTSIIDLDLVPMESLSLQNNEHETEAKTCADMPQNSPSELDNLDSEMMMEKLDNLDWENIENIDFLLDNSMSIFMNSVLMKMKLPENSGIELQLKRVFSDFGTVLSKKLRNVHGSNVDLNSTIVFEKLEQELQKDIDLNELREQLSQLVAENNSLLINVEEMMVSKDDIDKQVATLTMEVSSLKLQLELAHEELKVSLSTAEALGNLNTILEFNSKRLSDEIRCLNDDFDKIHSDLENIKIKKDLSDNELQKAHMDLTGVVLELNSNRKEYDFIHAEKGNLEQKMSEMEQTINDLIMKNEQLNDVTHLKNDDEELEMLHKQVADITAAKEDIESLLTENGNILESTMEQKTSLQQLLYSKVLELDGVIADYIKCEVDLGSSKSSLLEKETQLVHARDALRLLEFEMKKARFENEEIKSVIQTHLDNSKVQSSEVTANIQDLKVKLETLIRENITEFDEIRSSRDEMKIKLEDLEILHADLEIKLLTVEDERDALIIKVDEYEDKCLVLAENCDIKGSDGLEGKHQAEIESLKGQVHDLKTIHEETVKELLNDTHELTAKNKAIEEKINMDTERFVIEISSMENKISELANELRCKKDALDAASEELSVLRQYKEATIEQGNLLKETENRLQSLEIALGLKDEAIVSAKKELETAMKLLSEMKKIKEKAAEYLERLRSLEEQLKEKEAEVQSLQGEIRTKEGDNEDLQQKVKEAVSSHMKEINNISRLWTEFNHYKESHSAKERSGEDKENVGRLQEEVATLKRKLKENEARVISVREFEALDKVYSELKERYRDKRRRTEELTGKYERLVTLCREKGVILPKTAPGGR